MRVITKILSAALLAGSALAQTTYTTTLPWVDGNTLVVAVSTNPLGVVVTNTISTVASGAAGGVINTLTTARTTATTLPTTTTRRTTTATGPTTTQNRVVGQDTSYPPMRTTTYWHDPGDGVWVQDTWTASVTAAPTVATHNVPAGTIQDYNSYQTVINSKVLASAQQADVSASRAASGAQGLQSNAKLAAAVGMAIGGLLLGYQAI